MKINHRLPSSEPRSATLDPAYEAEVRRSTLRGERMYTKAQAALASAERKVQRAERTHDKKRLRVALELLEIRRAELAEIESMMRSAPASASFRGAKSYRPVPPVRGSLL